MAIVVVGSVHGSPGATTLAIDLAHMMPGALLLEADPDGGCLAARLGLGLRPGLTELAGAARAGLDSDDLWQFAQQTIGAAIIVAHPSAEQVHAALRSAVQHIGHALTHGDHHAVIDVGRLRPGSPAIGLVGIADHVLVLTNNSVEGVVSLTHRAPLLAPMCSPIVVAASAKPYTAAEIERVGGHRVWGFVPLARRRRDVSRRLRALERLVAELISTDSPQRPTEQLILS